MSTDHRTPAETLRAAADRLDALDQRYPRVEVTEPYVGVGGGRYVWLGDADHEDPDCPDCKPIGTVPEGAVDLIATLRPTVAHLVAQFRLVALFVEAHYPGEDFPESSLPPWVLTVLPVARAVLGEYVPEVAR